MSFNPTHPSEHPPAHLVAEFHNDALDPVEASVPYIHFVLPLCGALLIFLLAFIAVVMT